jgi:serine protease Do
MKQSLLRAVCWLLGFGFFWSLPSLYAQTNQPYLMQINSPDRAFLGIEMEDVTAQNMATYKLSSERGVIVHAVTKGSPAETAKLQQNDVILEFGGFQVWSTIQLRRLVEETPIGRKADLVISRDGKKMNLVVQVGKRDRPVISSVEPGDRKGREYDSSGPVERLYRFFPSPPEAPFTETLPVRPRLGITIQSLTDQLAEFFGVPGKKGVLVTSITENSPASGKLKSGDVILGADKQSINSPEEFRQFIRKADGKVDFKVIRDKKEISVAVDLPYEANKGYRF